MTVLAIDPGPEQSAWLTWDGSTGDARMVTNTQALEWVRGGIYGFAKIMAIEMVACFGMPVGREVFETCLFIGRLQEASQIPARLVYRKDVKIFLCQSMRAKDANIRQALIDKHGPPGTKNARGKTYGISGHMWSALAVADYALAHFIVGNVGGDSDCVAQSAML